MEKLPNDKTLSINENTPKSEKRIEELLEEVEKVSEENESNMNYTKLRKRVTMRKFLH